MITVHGEWLLGLQLHCEVKGFGVTFPSEHMGTDIMHLGPMPGSGKGYDLTFGLWWNSTIRHTLLDRGVRLLAHLFIMQVACGGCSFRESSGTLALKLMRLPILRVSATLRQTYSPLNFQNNPDAFRDSLKYDLFMVQSPSILKLQTMPW